MSSNFTIDSNKPLETMFKNKGYLNLVEDATYLYAADVKENDKLSWVFEKDDKWHPIIHKSDLFQGFKRTYALYILSQKADGESASKVASAWAKRAEDISKIVIIRTQKDKEPFMYAKNAFDKLSNTYSSQHTKSSNQSDLNAAINYQQAVTIMENILEEKKNTLIYNKV